MSSARNRALAGVVSEHGRGNAIDIRSVTLANGRTVELANAMSREIRDQMRESACKYFTTVLGPGSDGFHENHIHLDLAERRSGYRICQWDLQDSAPVEEVPLPRPRPGSG